MRSAFFLLVLSVVLVGCSTTTPPDPISQVNSGTQVVLQSEIDNHEVIQEFDIDNCDGKADATRIEHRSSSIDVTVSTELAARIGASAQVISADVQAAVGTALSIGGERGTSIELKAPPDTHMFFQLAWLGKSRIGVVQNVSGSNIPVAFQSFSPDNVRIKSQYDIGCRNTPTPPTQSEPQPAVAQPIPSQPTTAIIQTPIPEQPSSNRRTSCLASPFGSLGSNWSGRVSEAVSQGTSRTYSHCPPEISIRYREMGFDDDLSKVVIVCPSESVDVTASFYRLDRPNEILPVYRSSTLTVPDGCRIDFTVIDTLGGNIAMHFSSERGE
jgi:hypothetical protein